MSRLDLNQNGVHSTSNSSAIKTIPVMNYITNGDNGNNIFVLAHGAGAPMDSDFMNVVAEGLAEHGVQVVRFEFPYMQQRRLTGKKRPPDRLPVLLDCWQQVLRDFGGAENLIIGGKSMGGRMASLIAAQQSVRGLVCLGYPFHPVGKPDRLRTEHLPQITSPTLIVQGVRDALGNREEVANYELPPDVRVCWLPDGDHDLKPRVKSGYTHQQHLVTTVQTITDFVHSC